MGNKILINIFNKNTEMRGLVRKESILKNSKIFGLEVLNNFKKQY